MADPFIPAEFKNPSGRINIIPSIGSRPSDINNDVVNIPVLFPNPLIKGRNAVGFVISRPQNYQDIKPFNQNDWQNPKDKLLKERTHLVNLLQSTLKPAEVQGPLNILDYTMPRRKGFLMTHVSSTIIVNPEIAPLLNNDLFDRRNLYSHKKLNPSWIQSRPFYYQDIKPFNQNEYPNPKLKTISPNTWIHNRKLDEFVQPPVIAVDYPNPKIKKSSIIDWIFLAPFQQIFTQPLGESTLDIPVIRKYQTLGWLQPRQSFYQDTTGNPIFGTASPNPKGSWSLIVDISTRFPLPTGIQFPFRQNEWNVPLRKTLERPSWKFSYTLDDNDPFLGFTFKNPERKNLIALSWIDINKNLVNIASNSIPVNLFPNPIILKKQTLTLINNLLPQLNPGIGATPFNQNEWPNPLKSKKNFHNGWIKEKPTYYVEQPLQPAQYDWPIFRAIKRNHVGFIDFKLQASSPRFTSITENAILKNKTALTWIFNSIIDLNFIQENKPFTQGEWPAFERKRKIVLDLINRGYIIPITIGRSICLLANIAEFDMEASQEDFDLEANLTEFKLEAGGSSCE